MSLQETLKDLKMLIHFNPEGKLYVDLDSSGKGIGATIYPSEMDLPTQKSVIPNYVSFKTVQTYLN